MAGWLGCVPHNASYICIYIIYVCIYTYIISTGTAISHGVVKSADASLANVLLLGSIFNLLLVDVLVVMKRCMLDKPNI